MKAWIEEMYWKTNHDWYKANHEKNCFELTKDAPPRAIESFHAWLKMNHLKEGQTMSMK